MNSHTPQFYVGDLVWRRATGKKSLLYSGFYAVIEEVVHQNGDYKPWYEISLIRDNSLVPIGMVAEEQLDTLK